MTSKKRCDLSLKRKLDILDILEKSKKSKRQLAEELGVPRSTLYDIVNSKEKLDERRKSGTDSLGTKRHRTAALVSVTVCKGIVLIQNARSAFFKDSSCQMHESGVKYVDTFGAFKTTADSSELGFPTTWKAIVAFHALDLWILPCNDASQLWQEVSGFGCSFIFFF